MRTLLLKLMMFFLIVAMFVSCCKNREISTQKNIISCSYIGLAENQGRPIVNLVFKNNSGKNIKSVFGGLRIINRDGDVLQRTGFTYSRPFLAGEEKDIPAFAYIDLKEEALNSLSSAKDYIPMIFDLSEVSFEDDQSITF